ncbi:MULTISPECIES: DUF6124 family protein [Pseudomonas]|uniref:DUF6124 family protein n=1 Tax=Pseudomonas TaxID=286 RepID=UPI001F51A74B|nr:hypothetical protein [Pseudomonas putida]MCI0911201.1 hypothetical protein [Pseudomonas putida]WAB99864.1 hypothetical protein OSW16_09565 [Pseudomonas putida]
MKPPKNDETELDSEAARRALDYYLNPNPPRPSIDNKIWTLHEGVTADQAQEHAIALLRCAAATAHETATHQEGSHRELTFALMHMMDMARALLEHKRAVQSGR